MTDGSDLDWLGLWSTGGALMGVASQTAGVMLFD